MQKASSDGEGSDLNDFDSDRDIPRWVHHIVSVVTENENFDRAKNCSSFLKKFSAVDLVRA